MRRSALYFGLVAAALVALGLVVLCSASQPNSIKFQHGQPFAYFLKQLAYVVGGGAFAFCCARIDYHFWRDHRVLTWLLYGAVFVLLLAVFPPLGRKVNGAYRWIRLGPVNLQPSELAKLAIVIMTAVWMDCVKLHTDRLVKGALVPFALIGVYAVPILAETDLGSTMVVGAAGLLVMFIAGTRFVYLVGLGVVLASGFLGVMLTNANRMRRLAPSLPSFVCNFLGIEPVAKATSLSDMDAASYQAYNSLVAIHRGGIFGVGLSNSMQKQYYLPEAHTDFVFAVGAEEMGLGFTILALCLFIAFFCLALHIAYHAQDMLGRNIAFGMAFIVFFQAMFNLGVICKAVPTKGMALPFFSYGGTNMISACIAIGFILSVAIHSGRDRRKVRRWENGKGPEE